jgi:hypothetical protein
LHPGELHSPDLFLRAGALRVGSCEVAGRLESASSEDVGVDSVENKKDGNVVGCVEGKSLYPSPLENRGNTEYNIRIGVFPLSIYSSRSIN